MSIHNIVVDNCLCPQYRYQRYHLSELWTLCLWDSSPTRHFAYYLDSSPTDCSFCQQDYQNKIKCV